MDYGVPEKGKCAGLQRKVHMAQDPQKNPKAIKTR